MINNLTPIPSSGEGCVLVVLHDCQGHAVYSSMPHAPPVNCLLIAHERGQQKNEVWDNLTSKQQCCTPAVFSGSKHSRHQNRRYYSSCRVICGGMNPSLKSHFLFFVSLTRGQTGKPCWFDQSRCTRRSSCSFKFSASLKHPR